MKIHPHTAPGRPRRSRGFSLIGLLVVLVILGLLAGLVGPQVMKYLGGAKTDSAKLQIEDLGAALDLYRLEVGSYPTTDQGLEALVSEPDIVLFDEPTSGQDPIRKNAILSMIAAHQQRHKFSAILISHDLPDVFFISNVILALYEGRVIFEGPPEEFEQFDHPFRTEFVHSLELLQRELTGLYSRRQFKMRYLSDLVRKPEEVAYTAAIFTIEDMPGVAAALGHSAAQELVATMGTFISKHFTDVGGFSTRYSMEAFVTVLPFAKVEETRRLIDNFRDDLTASGIPRMKRIRPAETACVDPVGITLAVGLAQGRPQTELGAVIASAVANQEHLARFNVICRGGSQP